MKSEKPKYIIKVYADVELKERLEKLAEDYGLTSLSSMVKFIVLDYLKKAKM